MDESKMGFFSRLYYSITSFDKYRNFLRQSTGKAVVYLLILSLFAAVGISIKAGIESNKFIDEVITYVSVKIPDFELANGKLAVKGQMPIVLEDGAYPIIIDTRPDADESILDKYDTAMLITSDKIFQKNFVDKRVTDLSAFQGMALNRESFQKALPLMKSLIYVGVVFVGIIIICGKFITALIVSLLGLIVNSARNTRLTYRSIFKISVYSMTLPVILGTVIDLVLPAFPYKWLLFYAITFVYIFGALNNIKKEIDRADLDNMGNNGDVL
ncbi:MAG TPA: DUF1189 domain-containing protein [Clostridia bacterium]|nr:DUF1189 domain-containing protein [Clostridia bacterium]